MLFFFFVTRCRIPFRSDFWQPFAPNCFSFEVMDDQSSKIVWRKKWQILFIFWEYPPNLHRTHSNVDLHSTQLHLISFQPTDESFIDFEWSINQTSLTINDLNGLINQLNELNQLKSSSKSIAARPFCVYFINEIQWTPIRILLLVAMVTVFLYMR